MYIGAALLCQAYIAPFSFFLVLMRRLCWILKTLQESKGLVLTINLIMQRLEKQLERRRVGDRAPARATMQWLITLKALDQLHESIGLRLCLATKDKPAYVAIEYFFLSFIKFAFLKLFCFFKSGGQGAMDCSIWG